MNSNNLLASVALFAELCNSKKDIRIVLNEFVKSLFPIEKLVAIDSKKAQQLLKKIYGFEIPEAVVSTALNSLKKAGILTRHEGNFHLEKPIENSVEIENGIKNNQNLQIEIEEKLVTYCQQERNKTFDEQEIKMLKGSLTSYLLDEKISDDYSPLVSAFIIKNESENIGFIDKLNEIKEGLIIYKGLVYTSDINHLGTWNSKLTFYLDTEHLFNLNGYNGEVFKNLYYDFSDLVKDANSKYKKEGKAIELKYFKEAEREVNSFFYAAEKILEGNRSRDPSKTAMTEILNGCSNISDILRKKSDFFSNLKLQGITLVEDDFEVINNSQYNLVDEKLIEKYETKDNLRFNEKAHVDILKIFSQINALRKGNSRTSFENVGHILLTGKGQVLKLSQDLEIKNKEKDIPFATDIYFTTNRLWFRLNKGFSKSNTLPHSLNVLTKAKVILSSQLNNSIGEKYLQLKKELKEGKRSKEESSEYYYELRKKAVKPEDLNGESVSQAVEFYFEDNFEKFTREKSFLESRAETEAEIAKEKEKDLQKRIVQEREKNKIVESKFAKVETEANEAKKEANKMRKEIQRINFERGKQLKNGIKVKVNRQFNLERMMAFGTLFFFVSGLIGFVCKTISIQDTLFTKITGFSSFLSLILFFITIANLKRLNRFLIKRREKNYLNLLRNTSL